MKTKTTFNLRIKTKWFLILIVLFVLSFDVKAQLSYCTATGGCDEYISNVSFSNINNASGCNNYTFYSAVAAINVVQGNTYPITVTNGNFYGGDSCEVWIDWNRDTVFDNATEYYQLVNIANPYTGSISVPYTALTGETRMRVRIRYFGSLTPCGNAGQSYGEVEDYKINVIAGSPMVLGNIMFDQLSGIAVPGSQNVNVSYLRILTSGGLNPLYVKNITLNSLNSYPYISDAQLFSVNVNSNTSYTTTPFGSVINNPSGNTLSFNDSVSLKPDTNYFLLTYSVSNSAPIGTHLKSNLTTVNINDTDYIPNSIDTSLYVLVVAPMSGNYTINNMGTGDYLNFNQAVNALITRGISGPVVFNVDNGTYYEQILIPSITGSSATNTITFKSTNNNNNGVILTYTPNGYNNNYTVQLQSASNIIFQNLTISSGYSTNYSRVFYITGASGNLSFTDNNIIGSESYSGWNSNLALMHFSSMGNQQMSNILITNNTLINGSFGVYFDTYGPLSLNNSITANYFYNQGVYGILVNNQSNLTISHNTIYADLSINYFYGIETDNCYGGIIINKNRINVKNAGSMYGILMNFTSGNLTPSAIINNFISLQSSYNSVYGISINNDSTIGVLYNSINITGGNNGNTYGLYIQNSAGLFFRNNIVSNTSHGLAIYTGICNQCSSDYNDYYSNGNLAYLSQADSYYQNLPSFVAVTQGDSNSISVLPLFLSDTNLHTFNIALNGSGTPIPGINSDIDGDIRNTTTPDIGADEFNPPANDLELIGFLNVPNGCGLSNNEKIKVIIKNSGTANYVAGNATVKFLVDIPQQLVNETVNRNITSGDTIEYIFTSGASLSVNSLLHDTTFSINAWVSYTGDNNNYNDSIYTTLLSRYLPPAPGVTDTIINYSTNAILNAQLTSDFIPLWYDSLTSVNVLKIGNPYITPILFTADTFYVSDKKTGLDYGTIATNNNTIVFPFYTYYPDIRTQFLYTAQELQSAGLMPGPITSMSFNISSYSTTPMNGFTIKMQNSSLSSLSSLIETGWSTVYSNTYTVASAYGWQEINFQTPFIWDGVSNILINTCFDNTAYGSYSYVYASYIPTPNMLIYSYSSSGSGCNLTYSYTYSYRPDIRFKGTMMGNGCESNRAALHVGLNNVPGKDVGVTSILEPNSGFEISNPVDVNVIVKNFGSSTIDTILVSYQKADTSVAVTETIIRNVATGDTIHYTFMQKADITALGTYNFKAYAHVISDTVYMNDTSYKTVQNYTYCNPLMYYGCSIGTINSVVINTLNNTASGCNPNSGSQIIYPESSFTTSLQKSITYPITISPVNNNYGIGYGLWIDLNHDGDFDDTGEFLFNTYTSTNASGSILIPSTYTYTGKTKMRIRTYRYNYLYANNSCTPFSEYGETEDYTITIHPEPFQKDLQLLSIVSPDSNTYQLVAKNVTVQVRNIGLDTISQIPLSYIFNSQAAINYTWNGQLIPQQTIDINLPQITPNTANNSILIYSGLTGDLDLTNDTLFKSFVALPAPALISISPDTIYALIASCDSSSSQTLPLTINNNGYQALNYQINQNTGMNDDFESGTNKWIFNGSWGLISDGYNSLYSLTESPDGYYGDNWNTYAQLKDSMYIANKDSSFISFMLKYAVESCCDRLYPQISVNNGSWTTIANYGSNGSEAWNLKMIPINSYVNNGDFVKFRFNFVSDYSVISDGMVIDNFFINGIENGNWATFSKLIDTVQASGNSLINVTFQVGQLNAGLHSQNVIIRSNDPTKPLIKLPLYLTIIGTPMLDVYDSIRVMPSVMAGVTTSSSFKLYNNGCDSLKITALNHYDSAFSLVYPANIMPRDSGIISVNFNSLFQGLHTDTLTLLSNSETKHFFLSGTILPTPQLVLIPDSFVVYSSNCSDTIYETLKIKNTGNTTLNWDAYFSKGAEKALSFNGTNSEVNFGNIGTMPQKGCIEFWVKTNINNTTKVLFSSSGMNYSWRGINIYQGNNYFYAIIGDDVGNYYTSYTITSNVDFGKWHHIAVTWDKTQNKVWTYWDGNVVTNGSTNTYWPTTLQESRLGVGYHSSYGYYFNGQIDEFRMWSQTRSQTEIKSSYQEALVIPTPDLVGLWGFNEASGDTVYGLNTIKTGVLSNITRVNSGANIKTPGLDVYPTTGVLNAGDSNNVQVTFITTGLNSGNIYSGIGLKTNDPLKQVFIVPTHLILTGAAQIQMFSNNLNFNNIMAGATITDSVGFTNTGCDSLKITNITHNNSIFTLNKSSFMLLPRDTAKLKITFNPVNIGIYYDTIIFYTNIGNFQIFIQAQAVAAPVASVSPASIFDTITVCNQSNSKTFKIKNTGNEVLTWNGITSVIGMSDNFESGLSKWTFSGNWGTINQGYNGGSGLTESPAGYYGDSWYQYIQLKDSIYILNKDSCKIKYMLKRNMECCCDYLNTQISVNGGVWTSLSPSFNCNEDWSLKQFQFSSYVNNGDYVKFRFLFTSDWSAIGDGVVIDDFSINSLNVNNINPSSGTVAIGDSTTVQLNIDGQGLVNGKYFSQVIINTNDPVHYQISIPVQLVVKANPLIAVNHNPLIMDTLMIGLTSSKQLVIRNTGCDSLKVTSITHLLSEFTVSPTSVIILPRDSAVVNVNFSSLNIGNFIDTLKIFNNAGDINVVMKAKTLGAPEIISLPDLITANISCDTSSATLLKLKNPGIVPLNWNAFVAGQEKGALQFNGVNNYISTGYWSPGNKWTVEAWVNPDVLSYGTKLIAGSAYAYAPWGICMVGSKFAGIYYSSQTAYSQTLVAENFTVTAGVWYHVACTYNGTTIRLFINGQQVNSAVVNSNYTAYSYPYIGGDPSWANYFSGKIDEVKIWNTDRSQSKISYTMNHIMPENETGLQAYWLFNKLNGSTVDDKTSNGHNGSFNGTINSTSFTSNASPVSNWVNLSNYAGVLGVGDSTYINVSINRHLLPQGAYPFNLIIQSDDPAKPYDTTLITLNAQYNLTPVDLGSDTNLCTGNALTVFAGSYSSYVWSNNTYNSSLNVTSTGTYNVLVTDANGCNFRDTIFVGLTQSPIADGGLDKSVCQNNSVSLNGSATGGNPPYQYIWKDNAQNIISNVANYSFVPANSTMFFLSVTDNNGCQSPVPDTVNVTLNLKPIVSAGNDTTINLGSTVMLNGSISGGTYPYTIQWSPSYYMSATNILNPSVNPTYSIYYNLNVTDANNCLANDNVYISVKYLISGFVVYNNVNQTPMPNVKVYLENSAHILKDSVVTATDGSFMFSKVNEGYNYIYAKPVAAFGGVNATDALGIRRHIVGFTTLSGVNYSAADVNGSATISSADALIILRRTIGLISSFPISDWISEKSSVFLYNNVQNLSVKVLCTGDVNGSYNIFSSKSTEAEPELNCIPLSTKLIAGETFNLPVNFTKKIKLGAVTLNFKYPYNLIDIIGVTSNGNEVEFNIKNDILSLAMADEKGLEINGNNLLLIKCRVKPDALNNNIALSLSGENELADINGKVISGLQLETNCVGIAEKFSEYKLEDIYPNPFSDFTTVRIFIPEDASLRLSIINSLGVEVKSLQTERLSTGWHEIKINADELTQGAYMYRMQAVGSNTIFDQTRRMMIIR